MGGGRLRFEPGPVDLAILVQGVAELTDGRPVEIVV